MENKSCVSCQVPIKKEFMYCFQCYKSLDNLNQCQGVTANKTKCQLKCVGHGCLFHCQQIKPKETYASVVKNVS